MFSRLPGNKRARAPARFFLDVDTLSLSLVGQHAAADIRETLFDGNLGSSPVCDQFSAGLKGRRSTAS